MSKVISPIVFRSKSFNTYTNKQFLSFDKKYNNITYFKFFNIYINLISLVKKSLGSFGDEILGKYLYTRVKFINIKFITIDFIFSRLYEDKHKYIIENLFLNINLYFNYFKKYKFYGNIKNFFIIQASYVSYYNFISPLHKFKFNFYDYKRFKQSIIYHCNKIFKFKYKKRFKIKGIKIIFSGRLVSPDNRAKIDIYTRGTLSMHTIDSKFYYFTDSINTDKGVLGIKIWINVI